MEAVWMSLPRRSDPGMSSWRLFRSAAACSTKNAARRFTFITRSHSSPVTSNMDCTRMTPALLKSTSSRPQRRYTSSTIRSMSSFRVTSALMATWPSSPATFSTLAPSRSASTSRAPSAVSRRAAAAPMPLAAPVMSTVRPLRLGISSPRVLACERRSVLRGRRGHLEPSEREGDRPAAHESSARHLVAADRQLSDQDRALILEGEHVVGHAALDGQEGLPARSDPRRAGIDGPGHLARSLLKLEAELPIDHRLPVRTSHEAQPHAVHVLGDHGSIDPRRLGTAEAEEERDGEEDRQPNGDEQPRTPDSPHIDDHEGSQLRLIRLALMSLARSPRSGRTPVSRRCTETIAPSNARTIPQPGYVAKQGRARTDSARNGGLGGAK